jgi:uncharacterized membrane protein
LSPLSDKVRCLISRLNQILLLSVWLFSLIKVPVLPTRMPLAFNGSGSPESWQQTTLLTWLALPLIALGLNIFVWLLIKILFKFPKWVNLPRLEQRRVFQKLAVKQREPVRRLLTGFIGYLLVPMNLMFLAFQVSQYYLAARVWKTLPGGMNFIFIAVVLILLFMLLPQLSKEVDSLLFPDQVPVSSRGQD